jgi:hypothetical protein
MEEDREKESGENKDKIEEKLAESIPNKDDSEKVDNKKEPNGGDIKEYKSVDKTQNQTTGDELSKTKSDVSKETERYNKHMKIMLTIIGLFVVLLLSFLFVGNSLNNFEFKGTGFSILDEGELRFYKTTIPLLENGVHVADYNLFLHKDPRTLEHIPIKNNEIILTGNIVIDSDDPFHCDGDGIIALANMVKLYETFGANVIKNESLECDRTASYTHIMLHKDDETSIERPKHNCYRININNCEILEATEKFMIESLASARGFSG